MLTTVRCVEHVLRIVEPSGHATLGWRNAGNTRVERVPAFYDL